MENFDYDLENANSLKRKKYFVKLIYDAIVDSDDSNECKEFAIDIFANALEKFVKNIIAEERNKMLMEVKNEIRKNIEEYIKPYISASHDEKFLNNASFMTYMIQKINETRNLAQGSQAIVKDTNEKSEMIIELLEKLENTINMKIGTIEELVKQLRKSENLTATDKQILNFVKEKGIVCAEDVQNEFKYKGKNAASARLNILYRKSMLEKIVRDRKVYYQLPSK